MTVSCRMIGFTVLSGTMLLMAASPRGQAAAEVFTATASVKGASGPAVTITIDHKNSLREADALKAAFKSGGGAALRKALVGMPPTGS